MTPDTVRDHRLRDTRDRVTPDDLNVAPELLGAPLARPLRRLVAITIDVAILAALSNFGNVWLVAGFGLIALVFLRDPLAGGAPWRRWLLWSLAAGLIGLGAQQAWVTGRLVHAEAPDAAEDELASAVPGLTPLQVAEARIAVLQGQLAEARQPKSFDLGERVQRWGDEVGLGLGWAIVYFALVPVWWKGQTVGKRLLGLRVVELTGKPMTVMRAFKRYGGYAAGVATGLFGFAQVLWDPNRQAIQDKTAHTVVIDLRRQPPAPADPTAPEAPR